MDRLNESVLPSGFVKVSRSYGLSALENDRLSAARIHADAIEKRYYANTRATTSRLAAELRSEYDLVRRAALLRLVRRFGFVGARDVYGHIYGCAYGYEPGTWRFRHDCQMAAGAVLARCRDE